MVVTGLVVVALLAAACTVGAEEQPTPIEWRDAQTLTVEGRGWDATESFFNRLPARAKGVVRDPVWDLAQDSAGIVVRFATDAPEIRVRWKLRKPDLAMPHMAATGVSGVDLYVMTPKGWHWLAVGQPQAQENEAALIADMPREMRQYALYLPLYNGVTSVELGLPKGAKTASVTPRTGGQKPVVFYGTSITQGGCACRPAMAYPALIGRRLDMSTINLGFSGNGMAEPEVAELLAELDPAVYVLDCLPNMTAEMVTERMPHMLKVLRAKHPQTPVILVEHAGFQFDFIRPDVTSLGQACNEALQKVYKDAAPDSGGLLYLVKHGELIGTDGEGTVDGDHATDLGFMRMADTLTPAIRKALKDARR